MHHLRRVMLPGNGFISWVPTTCRHVGISKKGFILWLTPTFESSMPVWFPCQRLGKNICTIDPQATELPWPPWSCGKVVAYLPHGAANPTLWSSQFLMKREYHPWRQRNVKRSTSDAASDKIHTRFSVFTVLVSITRSIYSLLPGDTIWRRRAWSTVDQTIPCCLTAPTHNKNQYLLDFFGNPQFHWKYAVKMFIMSVVSTWLSKIHVVLKLSVIIDKWFQNGNWSNYRWKRFNSRSGPISHRTSSAKLNDIIR